MQSLKLVDWLALDRTRLANERTILAYSRSAFAVLVAGVSFIKIFESDLTLFWMGCFFMALSPILFSVGIYGSWRFNQRWKPYLKALEEDRPDA